MLMDTILLFIYLRGEDMYTAPYTGDNGISDPKSAILLS